MKKVIVFILMGGIYILLAIGASWANNSGTVDDFVNFLGLQSNSVQSDNSGGDQGPLKGTVPSNLPIPSPPTPPPNVIISE